MRTKEDGILRELMNVLAQIHKYLIEKGTEEKVMSANYQNSYFGTPQFFVIEKCKWKSETVCCYNCYIFSCEKYRKRNERNDCHLNNNMHCVKCHHYNTLFQ